MSYLVVPNEADQRTARVWVAAIDEPAATPAGLELVSADGSVRTALGTAWDGEVASQDHRVRYRRVNVTGLDPRRRYRLDLRRAGPPPGPSLGDAIVSTLPERLPGPEEQPLTILLGSCFARQKDGGGTVGSAYTLLPGGVRPDLKVLCGDQVYLDAVSLASFFSRSDEASLKRRHLATYLATWGQDPGFRQLLRDGANLFSSDDHDFWNNAPNPSATAPHTFLPGIADRWWQIARDLYTAFQRPVNEGIRILDIGPDLSICLADTRLERSRNTDALMSADQREKIEAWAAGLTGPGCLVIGQLLFSAPAGWQGRFMDWGLANFPDYQPLVQALVTAPHSIVILTGDVHYGRVAIAEVAPGREVVEVVASPLALIAPIPANTWSAAPVRFPTDAAPGFPRHPVRTTEAYTLNANHFATVELSRAGAFTRLRVRAWPIDRRGLPPAATVEFDHRIS